MKELLSDFGQQAAWFCVPWERKTREMVLEQEEGPRQCRWVQTPRGWNLENRGNQRQELRLEHTPEVRSTDALNLCQAFICASVPAHAHCAFVARHQKLISRSKKELENFIRGEFGNCNLGRASQKALRTVLPVRSQDTSLYTFFFFLRQRAVHQMMYYWQLAQPRSKRLCGGSWDPLRDQEGILCQGVVLLMLGECCSLCLSRCFCWRWAVRSMQSTDKQWQDRDRGVNRQRRMFMFKFFLSWNMKNSHIQILFIEK